MKYRKSLLIIMLIISWSTIPFLGWKALKKYLPSVVFITILNKLLNVYGVTHRWWRHYKGIGPFASVDFIFLGPFFVSGLWMLKQTYGNFLRYFIFNKLLHIIFIYGGVHYLDKAKLFSLKKITKQRYLFIHFSRGLLLYLFQLIYEKLRHGCLSPGAVKR